MATTLKMTIQLRRDTTANWELHKSEVPAAGEPCFDTDLGTLKIGDGIKTYEELEVIGGGDSVAVSADGKSIVLSDGVFALAGFNAADIGAQPRKKSDDTIEWVVPSAETVDGLQTIVAGLQTDVANIQEILTPSAEGEVPLLTRVQTLEELVGSTSVADQIAAAVDGIETGTQVNKIEAIKLGENLLDIVEKTVTIPVGAGLKASDEITVSTDGTLGIGKISVSKLVQGEGEELILDGGGAT